jgi:glycosyltransferase involved in cell wall biosynthesis
MKVAMISRPTLFTSPGGDTIQVENTARELRNLGIEADVKLSNESIQYSAYDLLHFFNIIRPANILSHIRKASMPFLVSTIFVDYSEYEKRSRPGWRGAILRFLDSDRQEYLKVIARRVLNGERVDSPTYIFKGHRNSVKYILNKAAMSLPNSESEYNRLQHHYGMTIPYRVIPYAVDDEIFKPGKTGKDKQLVLCAGRIEGRKNQLNLIRALNETHFKLILVGSASPNHRQYYEQCRREAGSNVEFISGISQVELAQLYSKAKVHVLPSWFETAGLSSLEAAAMHCNIVITDKGDTQEYFGNNAFYCEPDDIDSIRKATELAAMAPINYSFSEKIKEKYNWKHAAWETKKAYEEVLKAV